MAALVQTYPAQQSSTPASLMQPRSQSSSGNLHGAQGQAVQHAQHNINSTRYNSGIAGSSGYRSYNNAPVAPYAFTSTPGLSPPKPSNPRPDRSSSLGRPDDMRQGYTSLDSISPDSGLRAPPSYVHSSSRSTDDLSSQYSRQSQRPLSTIMQPSQPASPVREKPDRYKRVNRNSQMGLPASSAQPSGSGMAAVSAVYSQPSRANSSPSLSNANQQGVAKAPFIGDYTGQLRSQSVDDIDTYIPPSASAQHAQASRRRSVGPGSITAENFQNFLRQELAAGNNAAPHAPRPASPRKALASDSLPAPRPGSRRTGSTDSTASGGSSRASSHRNSVVSTQSSSPSSSVPPSSTNELNSPHVPPRTSSADVTAKRTTAPSPLSRPAIGPELGRVPSGGASKSTVTAPPAKKSSAADRLAALDGGQEKGMKNRLRRAFSFGSAAELRKASAANSIRGEEIAERARLRQEKFREEQIAEQERVARRQEASGLGESIYSIQGNFFAGSTDNVSVSSTASSASIMIRKMGQGIKKSSRSLVGLFRPKSVVGVEAANGPIGAAQPSTGQISMITVEAERERVNVNANVAEHTDGGTGFPKLERNSLDMAVEDRIRRGSTGDESSRGRRSIVGGEKERAEILAAVRKGILKRSGSASPVARPEDVPSVFQQPEIPGIENQRPKSGKRSKSVKEEGGDYFLTAPKPGTGSHSAPSSPNSISRYNVSFSPRITFHDTWPSGEYDRRGDVATCNRLTPALAQQIKEELNTFKMEMDVHEESKVYTHFF